MTADDTLGRTTSTPSAIDGYWGEPAGHAVDLDHARQQLHETEAEAERPPRHRPPPSRTISSLARTVHHVAESWHRESALPEQEGDRFDLRSFLEASCGPASSKPLGVAWDRLSVSAPAKAVAGATFVKTVPVAIGNTFWRDPWAILTALVPPLSKVGHQAMAPILHPNAGVVRAGEMLLVIGSPGSGCTTFLRAITSTLDASVEGSGEVTYGGLSPEEINKHFRGEVVFVSEQDDHFPTLSVAETLRFALRTKVPNRASRQGQSRDQFIEQLVDVYLNMFGMPHVKNSFVGNDFIPGVSGGERKRVTIAESMATRAAVQANDNTTRGLDASTALDYARSLRLFADIGKKTVIATLYQVSEKIVELFDWLAVMNQGRVIYYGPRNQARQYFIDLGFQAGQRQTTADFLTAVTDPSQIVIRPGHEKTAPTTPDTQEAAWHASELFYEMNQRRQAYLQEIQASDAVEAAQLKKNVRSEKNRGVHHSSTFTIPFWKQVQAVLRRQLLLKLAARGDFYVQLFTCIVVPLVIGSIFWEGTWPAGALVFASLFVGWCMLTETFEAVTGRTILARQKQFGFASPSATVIARAIVDVPYIFLLITPFSIIFYFMSHLRYNAGAFFIFWILSFFATYQFVSLFRALSALSPSFNEAIRWCVLALNTMFIFMGYIIPRTAMPWTVWLSYVSAYPYLYESLMANEYRRDMNCPPTQIIPFGQARDEQHQTCAMLGARPGRWVVRSQDYLMDAYGYRQNHVGLGMGCAVGFSALYIIITLIASELLPWNGGSSTMVFARTKRSKAVLKQSEAERLQPLESDGLDSPSRDGNTENKTPSPSPPTGRYASEKEGENTRFPSTTSLNAKEAANKTIQNPSQPKGFDRPVLSWKDLTLSLDSGVELLHNASGVVQPGRLLALMGSSGAGKTTLLNTLFQRMNAGHMSGSLMVDGGPLPASFNKSIGFVMQGDVHLPTQTVREAIAFSAVLRQAASISYEQKMKDVDEILRLLELEDLQDAIIGSPGAGLSIERRKRVTIAVELAARPTLALFLDEPTSGLDSAGAMAMCRLLRRLAAAGQAIICTIHQPSQDLFNTFDDCLLLQNGGRVVYNGPIGDSTSIATGQNTLEPAHCNTNAIRAYFESQGAPPCGDDENVAEYILELTATTRDNTSSWSERWSRSPNQEALKEKIDAINAQRALYVGQHDTPESVRRFSASSWVQLRELVIRQYKDIWRDSSFTYSICFSFIMTGFIGSAAFAHIKWNPQGLTSGMFIMLLILLSLPAYVNGMIGKWFYLRMVYDAREKQSNVYSWWVLITSVLSIGPPLAILSSTVYFLPAFYISFYSQPTWRAGYFYLMTLVFNLYAQAFSVAISVGAPTPVTASNGVPLIVPLFFMMCGIIVPHNAMPTIWKALYWSNPVTYYVRGQIATALHDRQITCSDKDFFKFAPPPGQTCGAYAGDWSTSSGGNLTNPDSTTMCHWCQYSTGDVYLSQFFMPFDFRWKAFGIFVCFTAGTIMLCYPLYYFGQVRGLSPTMPIYWLGHTLMRLNPLRRRNKNAVSHSAA